MHYSLLVEAKSNEDIEALMFSYMESGAASDEDNAKLKALGLVVEYIEDGETYNNNKQGKWDWWVIGGRYTGIIPGGLTVFQKKAVSLEDFDARLRKWAEDAWDSADLIIQRHTSATLEDFIAMDRDSKQLVIDRVRLENRIDKDEQGWQNLIFGEFRGATRAEHIAGATEGRAMTYGYLTAAGAWNERETWYRDPEDWHKSEWRKNENYVAEFAAWYNGLDPETWLTVVDYHS